MDRWSISGGFLVNKEDSEERKQKIKRVDDGPLRNQIKITLEDGSKKIKDLRFFEENAEEKTVTEECLKSRTLFLKWLGFQNETDKDMLKDVTDDFQAERTEQQEHYVQEERTAQHEYDVQEERTEQQEYDFQEERNAQQEHDVQEERTSQSDNNEVADTRFCSIDKEMIKKHLKGENISVHIDNLIEPSERVKVRNLNQKFVEDLAQRIRQSYDKYTILIGLVKKDIDLENLKISGAAKVEVLGGNHTRAALQLLSKEPGDRSRDRMYVRMDVYSRLSDLQALHLAYSHNDMHENSRQMSFAEKVELFHNIRDRIVKSYKDTLGERQIATKWREEVANITSKTKAEVKNCYRTHLFLASFSGELWDALSGVLKPSKTKHISKNEKVKELTQYHFVNFSKVETTEERIKLLQQLSNKEIKVEEFRDICVGLREPGQRHKKKGKKRKTEEAQDGTEKMNSSTGQENEQNEFRKDEKKLKKDVKELKKQLDEKESLLLKETDKNKLLTVEIEKYKEKIEEMERTNNVQMEKKDRLLSLLEHKLEQQEKNICEFKNKNETLTREKDRYKAQAMLAEETAARARASVAGKKKITKETTKTDEKETVTSTEKVHQQASVPETIYLPAALVEYDRGKVYLGVVKEEMITFCHQPIGVIKEKNFQRNIKKQSLTLNKKDQQTLDSVDSKYIIKQFKANFNGGIFEENCLQDVETYVKQYILKC